MSEHENKTEEAQPETWGPTKPPRLLLFGRRYETPRGVRRRTDKNRTPIGQRVDKMSRRYWRRNFAKHYAIRDSFFGPKTIRIDAELDEAHKQRALARENTENSHEAKRLYEKDRAWRREERKKAAREDWETRTAAGELLRPLGVQPTRQERKLIARAARAVYLDSLKNPSIIDRMEGAIGCPSSGNPSETTTEPSPTP